MKTLSWLASGIALTFSRTGLRHEPRRLADDQALLPNSGHHCGPGECHRRLGRVPERIRPVMRDNTQRSRSLQERHHCCMGRRGSSCLQLARHVAAVCR